jgi:hypothetical protein
MASRDLTLSDAAISSERYLSNLHFYKEGTFNHRIRNFDKENKAVIQIQEYFPKWLKPYAHEIKIIVKEIEGDKVEEIQLIPQ